MCFKNHISAGHNFYHCISCHCLQIILCPSHADLTTILPTHFFFFLVSETLLIISLTFCKTGSFLSFRSHLRWYLCREAFLLTCLDRSPPLPASKTTTYNYPFLSIFAFCLSHNSAGYLRAGTLSGSLSNTY